MKRDEKRLRPFLVPVLSVLGVAFMCALPLAAQQATGAVQVLTNAIVNDPVESDVSPTLLQLVQQPTPPGSPVTVPVRRPKLQQLMAAPKQPGSALPTFLGQPMSATILLNFDGVSGAPGAPCPTLQGFRVAPPDTNAAVGDTQVVQWVNLCFAVFDKGTGALLAGPFLGNKFFAGMKSSCATQNAGDPIIQWDKANHVWLASQNVFGPYLSCVAISQTADATGAYNRYAFPQPGFPDYPKWGLTPDIYYQTQNDFGFNDGFQGVNVCAYDGIKMRAGRKTAKQICILDNSNGTLFDDSMLPADLDSAGSSSPEILMGSIDNPGFNNAVYQYVFTVEFKGKASASLAGVNGTMPVPVPAFSLACGGFGACVQQPSPGSELLDSLGDRLMYRLARSDDGTTQHFMVTHSVNNLTATAARWYEFTAPSGSTSLSLAQNGETPDDGHFRWMGSIARDKNGNIALGYSRSSAAPGDYPSLYASGQTAGEPAGTTDLEALIFQGTGSQFATSNRWGDYSSMALDGADHCSFWYTTEYYPADGVFAWNTRIAKLKYPGCI